MYELPEDFHPDWPLHRLIIGPADPAIQALEGVELHGAVAEIGPHRIEDWDIDTEDDTVVVLRESTYKHYKFYTSGQKIDQIQMLARHSKATMNFGKDEDGDVFWEVRFKVSDFKEVVRE